MDLTTNTAAEQQPVDSQYQEARKTYPEKWVGTGNVRAISPRAKQLAERYQVAHQNLYGGRKPKLEFALSMIIELAMPELGVKLAAMEAEAEQRKANQF